MCLETLHKAPAFCSKVELVFGSNGWLGCVCTRVLGFVEFCVPTLHFFLGKGGLERRLVADSHSVSALFQGSVRC